MNSAFPKILRNQSQIHRSFSKIGEKLKVMPILENTNN